MARTLSAALCAVVLLLAGSAQGHPQFALSTVNRYSKLTLTGRGDLRLSYVLMVGDVPAFALRQKADTNRDGRVDDAEGAALARGLRDQILSGLTLALDGKLLRPELAEPVLGLAGDAVAPSSFSVDLSATVRLSAAPGHEVRYEDRAAIAPIGEIKYTVEEGPGVQLLLSQQGQAPASDTVPTAPAKRTTLFRFYGPPTSSLSDRSITVRFSEPAPPAPPQSTARWAGAAAALLLVLGAGLWSFLRLRSRSRTSPACSRARSS